MRFKPHMIHRDTSRAGDQSEPELPVDLDFLAQRLLDEAAGLTESVSRARRVASWTPHGRQEASSGARYA